MGISVERRGVVTRITFFPLRHRLAPGFALAFACFGVLFGSERLHVRCHRAADTSCRVRDGALFGLLGDEHSYGGITGARVETGKPDDDGVRNSAIFLDSTQGKFRVGNASNMDVDVREDVARRIAELARPGSPADLEVDTMFPTSMLIGGGALIFAFLFLAFVRSFGKAGFQLNDARKTLSAFEGRAIWPPVGYDELQAVAVEEEKGSDGDRHLLVRVLLKDGSERKLATGYMSQREAERAVAEISERMRQ